MEAVANLESLYLAMSFIVPGYVFLVVKGHVTPGHRARGTEAIVRLLSISTLNFVIWAWAIYLVLSNRSFPDWATPAVFTFAILISPALLGLISGFSSKYRWLTKIYKQLGFHPVHNTPTSWDYAFSQPMPRFIIVKLSDGGKFAGYWGPVSFASDEPSERDIFIERVYIIDKESGQWHQTDRSVLLRGEHVRSIEFIPIPDS